MAAVEESIDSLLFLDDSLNLIWSERAIYDMGVGCGIEAWKRSLRRGGVLVVSEITWRCPEPPSKIAEHRESEYPKNGTESEKVAVVERAGYDLLGYFVCPASCWELLLCLCGLCSGLCGCAALLKFAASIEGRYFHNIVQD